MRWNSFFRQFIPFFCLFLLLTTSVKRLDTIVDKARLFTGGLEYNYIAWTLNAVNQKAGQGEMNAVLRLTPAEQSRVVTRYFELVRELEIVQANISVIYSDPRVTEPRQQAADFLLQQGELEKALNDLAGLAEDILQSQVSQVLQENGLGFLAQQVPPVLFHSTPLPMALIVSPRNIIREDVNISLLADLSLEQITKLEDAVAKSMDASTLVEGVGGVGVYPTMVQRASSLQWMVDTIAHEWTHNYLTLHPLGVLYDKTPQLRTMNETTASIVGTEISDMVLQKFYPDYTAREAKVKIMAGAAASADTFDFNREMHTTRVTVDELLAQGMITEAETYMDQRRVVFVEHGYMIRKLNQAYFAFHGAYAEQAVGAAGADPVGPAVRELRANSKTLAEFLRRISWMSSFDELQQAVKLTGTRSQDFGSNPVQTIHHPYPAYLPLIPVDPVQSPQGTDLFRGG